MQVEITIKNYRCFSDSNPAHIILRKGFTAFVGVNNSGKSALLKFFYEFRSLFQLLSSPTESFIKALQGNHSSFKLANTVRDIEEVFCNANNRDIEIQVRLMSSNEVTEEKAPPVPKQLVITIPRARNVFIARIDLAEGSLPSDELKWQSLIWPPHRGVTLPSPSQNTLVAPVANLSPFFEVFKRLRNTLYIGPFRNLLNVEFHDRDGEDYKFSSNNKYFDIDFGISFIDTWHTLKTGSNKKNHELIYKLTQNIKSIFGFQDLEINTSNSEATLLVLIDGKSYKLSEQGSGLAQFILVLANAAIKHPSYILIDEPELNLHPSLQLDFLTTLGSYAGEAVLFATHNIGLARASAELIYSIRKDADGESEVRKLEVTPRLSEFLGELSFSGYRELGFDKILLVEGSTEVKMIQQFLRKYGKDHQIVLLPLGGSQLIKESSEAELEEIKRICENVSALIDSELTAPEAGIEPSRAAFVEKCKKANIDCHVLERRAIENYLSDRVVKQVKGNKHRALEPYEALKDAPHGWAKADNWRIAQEMTREELEGTDLGEFLKRLCD
jgi:ABC-type cobalamin/Fe3+-siderophores transport system ATPase subunit